MFYYTNNSSYEKTNILKQITAFCVNLFEYIKLYKYVREVNQLKHYQFI